MAQLKDTTITGNIAVSGTTNLTGATQASDDLTLYASSGNSPALIFQRGTLSDTYNDWQIQDRGGILYFDQRGNGSSAWDNVASIGTSGDVTCNSVTIAAAPTSNMQVANKQYVDNAVPTINTTTITLPAVLWGSNATEAITVVGVTATSIVWVSPSNSSSTNIDNYVKSKIYCSAQGAGYLVFTYVDTKPTADIDVSVVWI